MNNFVKIRRSHTNWNISQNPTEVVIQRKGKLRENGKIVEVEEVLEPQTMRLYVSGGSGSVVIDTVGEYQSDRYYKLLASYDADIKAHTEVKDSFYLEGVKYEVKDVFPQSIHGEVVGKQCVIERVI